MMSTKKSKNQPKGSQDIRSFFKVFSSLSSQTIASKKRTKSLASSDEDIIPESPIVSEKNQTKVLKKRKVIESDSEDELFTKVHAKKPDKDGKTLKPVNALDVFGSEPIKQVKPKLLADNAVSIKLKDEDKKDAPKKKKMKSKSAFTPETELGIHDDPEFEKVLIDLDNEMLLENTVKLDNKASPSKQYNKQDSKTPQKEDTNDSPKKKTSKNAHSKNETQDKSKEKTKESSKKESNETPKKDADSCTNDIESTKPHHHSSSDDAKTPSRKRKLEYSVETDQERFEKRRHSAMLYQKFLNRSGPVNHGSKEIPKGKPDCLVNLCFIRTGVLESLDNDEFEDAVKKHGGRIVGSVSKKVNYVVAGDDPGPSKIEKATNYGIKIISENEFLDLIRIKSGMKPIYGDTEDEKNHSPAKEQETVKIQRDKSSEKVNISKLKSLPAKKSKKISDNHEASRKSKESSPKKLNDDIPTVTEVKIEKPSKKSEILKPIHSKVPKLPQLLDKVAKNDTGQVHLPWTEKYRPSNVKGIIGQQGDNSNMKRLTNWLQRWHKNHLGPNRPKLTKPSPWAKNDDGSYFKAALLSGSPGVGKTTTATLVAKELGFDVVEFNASDTRSKRLLHEEVSRLLSSKSLANYFVDGSEPTSRHVLLMDEVDGMAGNEDRGGVQELIALIKNTKVPIVCMCNDRNHQKIRSLANYCLDLRFAKPRLEQIRGAMMSVCFKEGMDIAPDALAEVISGAGGDIRQILTHLSLWSADKKTLSKETASKEANSAKKDTPLGPWEVCRKVFSKEEHKTMSVTDRARLFYYDYSMAPLFVQDNYLSVTPHAPKKEHLKRFFLAADSISMGDLIDTSIRRTNNWSLLDVEAMYASVLPGHYLEGHVNAQIDFPSWLGKNSRKNKFGRLLSDLQAHMRTSISGSKTAVNLDYLSHLRNGIVRPMVKLGTDGISESLDVMHNYSLLREDLDSLLELAQWPRQKDPMSMVDSKVKAAFTRTYNKNSAKLPYAVQAAAAKKKSTAIGELDEAFGEEVNSESDNEDVSKDAMVKAKKASSKKNTKAEEPSTSKRGGSNKGGSRKGKK